MDSPSMFLAPPFIYNLPNEILRDIFSLIQMSDTVKWKQNGKKRLMAQFMVLLQVCRAFRTAALESKALLHWRFDFTTLIPWDFDREDAPQVRILRIARLLSTLFADERFVQSLARKRDWTLLEYPEVLFAVMARIPTFEHTTQKVYLDFGEFIQSALTRLSVCQQITELAIDGLGSSLPLDLDSISEGFPCLQYLKIALTNEVDGSLNDLEHLISFEIISMAHSYLGDPFSDRVFPWASANSLVSLNLTNFIVPFGELCKLQDVALESWETGHRDIIDSFDTLEAYLETFTCAVRTPSTLTSLTPMFSRPSLSRLRSLTLRVLLFHDAAGPVSDDDYYADFAALVTEITDKCRDLRHLTFFNFPIDLRNLTCLSRLRKLRSITWAFNHKFIRGEGSIEEALGKVFKSFESIPKIHAIRAEEWFEPRVSRWPYHF
jgi:hypothetical protein